MRPVGLACPPGSHGVGVNIVPGVFILLSAVPLSPDNLRDTAVEVREVLCGPTTELLGVTKSNHS